MKNIFVSSTFRDMQAERDMIQEEVLPQLKSKAKVYGENINMIDLRWGVDTSELETEEGSMKVMSVCLDEVERSRPHMLIFLGDRYGSIIDPAITEKVIARKNSDFVLEDYAISITAMEVEFGALSQQFESLENCVVCMRKFEPAVIHEELERAIYSAENKELAEKQQAFKQKVCEKVQGRVIEYTGDWDEKRKQLVNFRTMDGKSLSEQLVATYEAMFQKDWENYGKLSWELREQLAVDALVESKLRTFKGRTRLLDKYYENAVTETGALILQGEVGSGKTSLMCKLMERLRDNGEAVFRFVAANSSMSENAMQLVQQMVYYLEQLLGESHFELRLDENIKKNIEEGNEDKYSDWLDRLAELAMKLDEEQKVYFVIDALDQMYQDESMKNLDFVLSNTKLRYILSCTSEFEIPEIKNKCKVVVEKVPLLSVEDAKEVIEGILTASSRNVYKEMQEAILAKQSANNPLYISMLIQRLNMMGFDELYGAWSEKDIILHGIEVIKEVPNGAQNAAVYMLNEAMERLDAKTAGIRDVINLIGISRNGLRENDIFAISAELGNQVSQLELSRLIHYLDTFFGIHQDGQIDFTHKVIRNGVRKNVKDEKYIKAIAKRIDALEETDDFFRHEGMYYARMTRNPKAAVRIFDYIVENDDPIVLEAIKAECLADKGEFICKFMDKLGKRMSFFCYDWLDIFDLRRGEIEVKEKVCVCFTEWLEREYKTDKNEKVAQYLAESYQNVGEIFRVQGKDAEALAYFLKARDVAEAIYEKDKNAKANRNCAECYENIALILLDNDRKEALEYYRKALEIREAYHREYQTRDSQNGLALGYHNMGLALLGSDEVEEIKEALAYFEKAVDIEKTIYEKESNLANKRNYAVTTMMQGEALKELDRLEEALAAKQIATELIKEIYKSERNIDNLQIIYEGYKSMGDILLQQDNVEAAWESFLCASKITEEIHNARQSNATMKYIESITERLADVANQKKDWENALTFYQRSLSYKVELYKVNPTLRKFYYIIETIECIEKLLRTTGKVKERNKSYERVIGLTTYLGEVEATESNLEILGEILNSVDFLKIRGSAHALDFYLKMLEVASKMDDKYHDEKCLLAFKNCYENLQCLYLLSGNMEMAESCLRREQEFGKEIYKTNPRGINRFFYIIDKARFSYLRIVLQIRKRSLEKAAHSYKSKKSAHKIGLIGNDFYMKGCTLRSRGEVEETLEVLEKAAELYEEACSITSRLSYKKSLAVVYTELAHTLKSCQSIKEAITYYKKALELREMIQKERPNLENLKSISFLVYCLHELVAIRGSQQEKYEYCKKMLEIDETIYAKKPTLEALKNLVSSVHKMASTLRRMGKLEEGLEYLRRCIELYEEIHEKEQTLNSLEQVAIAHVNVGVTLMDLGETEEGIRYYRKYLEMEEDIYQSSLSLESLKKLSGAYKRMVDNLDELKQYDELFIYYKKYLEAYEEIYKLDSNTKTEKELLSLYDKIAMQYRIHGRFDEAAESQKKRVLLLERIYRKEPEYGKRLAYMKALEDMAKFLLNIGWNEEAYEYQERALLESQMFYDEQPNVLTVFDLISNKYQLANILLEQGKTEEAVAFYENALVQATESINERASYTVCHVAAKMNLKLCEIYLEDSLGEKALNSAQEAHSHVKTALELGEKMFERASIIETLVRVNMVQIKAYLLLGMHSLCKEYFDEAEEFVKQLNSQREAIKRMTSEVYMLDAYGDYYRAIGELETAKEKYKQGFGCLEANRNIIDDVDVRKLRKALEQKFERI